MKLRLFRSLIGRSLPRLSALAVAPPYSGVEVSLSQLEASPALLDESTEHSMRMVCRLDPIADEFDAEAQLDRLSSHLTARHSDAVDLIVLQAPPMGAEELHSYVRAIQPHWSEFLEAHQTIGSRHGKLNAHGNPLNHHVLGVCHRLSSADGAALGTGDLAETVDIYSPTRLAITPDHLTASLPSDEASVGPLSAGAAPPPTAFGGLGEDLEAVVEATDLLYVQAAEMASSEHASLWALYDEVWAAQQLAGAQEVYAVCCAQGGADEADRAALDLAGALRRRFDRSAGWRAGAAERRVAHEAVARARRRFAPSSLLGQAATRFGLGPTDLDELSKAGLKERWTQLVLKAHPDVAGGSEANFQQLRAAYKVLLRAASA